tara:strand:+ start:2743 stop:3030 length:288 start_codon:yes stop_codon:yes gene_type:complete
MTTKYNNIRTQLQGIASVLISQEYNFIVVGNNITFMIDETSPIEIKNTFTGTQYNLSIFYNDGSEVISHSHHKVIDGAYFSYMLRKVPGTNNYIK